MANKATFERQKKLKRIHAKYAGRREELRKKVKDKSLAPKERFQAMLSLDRLPRDSCKIRQNNICIETGSSRGFNRFYQLSRHALKRMVSRGKIPGVHRASW